MDCILYYLETASDSAGDRNLQKTHVIKNVTSKGEAYLKADDFLKGPPEKEFIRLEAVKKD